MKKQLIEKLMQVLSCEQREAERYLCDEVLRITRNIPQLNENEAIECYLETLS